MQVRDAGGAALARAARSAVMLQRLNLGHNPLGSAAMLAFADLMRAGSGELLLPWSASLVNAACIVPGVAVSSTSYCSE